MNSKLLILLASAAAAGFAAQSAVAADLPARPVYREPAQVAPVANWTGVYVGAGGGYGLYYATSSTAGVAGGAPFGNNNGTTAGKGYFGVGQVGADLQLDRFVAGIFGDYNFSNIKGQIGDLSGPQIVPLKEKSAYAGGARVGYLITPQLLSYFDAGYTNAKFNTGSGTRPTTPFAPSGVTFPNQNYNGWFLGSGTEIMLAPGWFLKSEYRYSPYESKTTAGVAGAPAGPFLSSINMTIKPQIQTIWTELVYKFNWGS